MDINWANVLLPEMPLLEIVVRGTLVYLALFLMMRFVLKRQAAGLGVTDLLVVVLIADAAQNAMAADYTSVPDGILLVGTIVFWSWFLDWLSYHVDVVGRVVKPGKLQLIDDGRVLWRNMAKELVTKEELDEELRAQGIDDVVEVAAAYMESNGTITAIARDHHHHERPNPGRRV